jgi:PBP1b-binding outer membrane lipoprotein LpoB
MKKSLAIILLASVVLYSCSQYTCPTYTKQEPKKDIRENRI